MNTLARSVCPHDCPGACALEVEVEAGSRLVHVRGAREMPYTDGVICAKVGRYAERVHHTERLRHPLVRTGPKGSGQFRRASWSEALDLVTEALQRAVEKDGPGAVWPYWYAGTMGLVQRDGIERLARAMGWSQLDQTICSSIGKAGIVAGIGGQFGADPREMEKSELIVVWGMNPVYTQVNVMSWIAKARRAGAKLVVVDPFRTATADKADLHLAPLPGSDAALACAVMQVILQEGLADRAFLEERTDFSAELETHLSSRTPEWAAPITGLDPELIRSFARQYASTKKSFIRVGYGLTRSRNGASKLHAVSCLPALTGAWREEGGGFLGSASGWFEVDKTLISGLDLPTSARVLDMSQLGRILTGDAEALRHGPPVTAMLVQSSNPAAVAPEQGKVIEGLKREDLFLCVHEQRMSDTARYADVVLPATTFLEHPDVYSSYGHTFLQVAKPAMDRFAEAWSNHELVCALAKRLGAEHPGFGMDAWTMVDETLKASGYPGAEELDAMGWLDVSQKPGAVNLHERFPTEDGRFRFEPAWSVGTSGLPIPELPRFPDHWAGADTEHPFRLVPGPARNFLNSSFSETESSQRREGRPTVKMHPTDAGDLGIASGDLVRLGNGLGQVELHAELTQAVLPKLLVVESIWPAEAFVNGKGINHLTSADWVAPAGGAPFHDTSVWVERVSG